MKRSIEDLNDSKKTKLENDYFDFKTGRSTFERFITSKDITLEKFQNEYWEKKPLVIRRNDDQKWLDYVKCLFSLEQLKSIIEKKKIKYEQDINLCKLVENKKQTFNKKGVAKLENVLESFEKQKATIQFHQPQRFNVCF